jgi:predicted ATPase
VWLADLGALADPALLGQAVATVLGIREAPGRDVLATLAQALAERRLLLVLDNCEHLVDACARLADTLLRAGPGLHLLATSRQALGMAGEAAYRVPSLPLPEGDEAEEADSPRMADLAGYAAVRLFVERARLGQPGFALTPQNAQAVVQICRRLDGIPLAIELAAARLAVLAPAQLAGRLDDRFRLLTSGNRAAPERHQTLRAVVDWSYDLLSEPERLLFARLAVFAGGFTLEAAEQVCAPGAPRAPGGAPVGAGVGLCSTSSPSWWTSPWWWPART